MTAAEKTFCGDASRRDTTMDRNKLKPGALLEFYTDFVKNEAYYVDKTLFIRDVLENPSKVQLYTRPRRFGKTLSLTTFHTFIASHDFLGRPFDPRPYFEGRKIMSCSEKILSRMGKHPVIFMSLKECCKPTFEQSLEKFRSTVARYCETVSFLQSSEKVSSKMRSSFESLWFETSTQNELENSILVLSELITQFTGIAPYILIDEYDVPLNTAYHYGYYDEMVSFIRSLFSNGLKSNSCFEKAILTGCLRISKESIFTGFNNLDMYSIERTMVNEYFGFTKEEVKAMLEYYDLSNRYDEVQEWYDGYLFGGRHVYNPYSLVQCVKDLTVGASNAIRCFWTNSSSNDIIRDLVMEHPECRDDLEQLLRGLSIYKPIHEAMTYRDMKSYDENIWTLLYYTGYVKSLSKKQVGDNWIHEIKLVNKEIHSIFPQYLRMLFYNTVRSQDLSAVYQAFWDNDSDFVQQFINNVLAVMVSYYDTQEMFYHGMMLGILSHLYQYDIKSNREDGNGRTDIVLRDMRGDRAIVFEFKWSNDKDSLKTLPATALKQVCDRKYAEAIHKEGYKTVFAVGIGFCKKTCEVAIEEM